MDPDLAGRVRGEVAGVTHRCLQCRSDTCDHAMILRLLEADGVWEADDPADGPLAEVVYMDEYLRRRDGR